jgi:hypothetical protein
MSLTRRRNHLCVNLATALQQAENWGFPAGAATATFGQVGDQGLASLTQYAKSPLGGLGWR